MSLSLQLPPPRKTAVALPRSKIGEEESSRLASSSTGEPSEESQTTGSTRSVRVPVAPSYEERCQSAAAAAAAARNSTPDSVQQPRPKLFVPRRLADFDDGGAFPEIHVAQYPRHMGNPHKKQPLQSAPQKSGGGAAGGLVVRGGGGGTSTGRTVVNVEVDAKGEIAYDAIVTGGTNADRIVYTKWEDVRGGAAIPEDIALPTPEEEAAEAARTQAALQALVAKNSKTSTALTKSNNPDATSTTEFIKYTARPDAPGYNPAAATRIIQMVPALVDPLMPPKHKHIKAPRGPAEDVVPVLHAPSSTRKLTKEEQDAWKVPACISNWKNQRGYTIPLDKRLAADGRGLVDAEINTTNFAAFSESLWTAERLARAEVQTRAKTQQALAQAAAQERDEALRNLAQQARRERGGGVAAPAPVPTQIATNQGHHLESIDRVPGADESDDDSSLEDVSTRNHRASTSNGTGGAGTVVEADETEDMVAARQRDRLREERKRERERALRAEQNVQLLKKQRLEEERDVSEQIALGVHVAAASSVADGGVDARLYHLSAGMDAGFGAEDEYNAYTQPLFAAKAAAGSQYRPTRGDTEYNADEQYDRLQAGATSKFQPNKAFDGASGGGTGAGPRTAPVKFERAPPT
jgi:SNW domain-containing protein 1